MSGDVGVVVPVYFSCSEHVEMTYDLVRDVLADPVVAQVVIEFHGGEHTWISHGGSMLGRLLAQDSRVEVVSGAGAPFYALWNDGCRRVLARLGESALIGILNNDLRLDPNTLSRLAEPLRPHSSIAITYPDYDAKERLPHNPLLPTAGTYKDGGMWGCCFMVRGDVWQAVGGFDESYTIWYGDDDFERAVREHHPPNWLPGSSRWQVCRLVGLPFTHLQSRTLNRRPDLLARTEADRQRFVRKGTP